MVPQVATTESKLNYPGLAAGYIADESHKSLLEDSNFNQVARPRKPSFFVRFARSLGFIKNIFQDVNSSNSMSFDKEQFQDQGICPKSKSSMEEEQLMSKSRRANISNHYKGAEPTRGKYEILLKLQQVAVLCILLYFLTESKIRGIRLNIQISYKSV